MAAPITAASIASSTNYELQNSLTKAAPLTCTGHSRPVTHLNFSDILDKTRGPTELSKDLVDPRYLLISACKDGNPMLRNGVTGDWIGTYFGHKGAIWCTRLSRDGAIAISCGADFLVNVWNAKTGELAVSLLHNSIVRSCDLFPDVSAATRQLRLVSGSQDSTVRIWDVGTQTIEVEWTVSKLSDNSLTKPAKLPIRSVLWIRKDVVVTVTFEGLVTWWRLCPVDADGHQSPPERMREIDLQGTTRQVEYNDAHNLLIIAADKIGHFIDASSGETVKRFSADYRVSALCVDLEKKWIVASSADELWVHVYAYNSEELLETLRGHHGPVHTALFSPDNATLATGSEDGTIRIWKMVSGPYGLWRS